jgi:hypothetical protein
VTFPAFKAGDAFLRGTSGGFDFHTPPPQIVNVYGVFEWPVKSSAVHLPGHQPCLAARMARSKSTGANWPQDKKF